MELLKNYKIKRAIVVLTGSMFLLLSGCSKNRISVKDGWVAEINPASSVTAAYMKLVNMTSEPVVVTGASCDAFDAVEIHRMEEQNGVMTMNYVESLQIPPDGTIEFAPGAIHLMLIGKKRDLKSGDNVAIIFTLLTGEDVEVSFPVETMAQHLEDE